jgi:hypothetical protein
MAHNILCWQNFDPIKQFLYVRRINLMEKIKITLDEIWNIDVSAIPWFCPIFSWNDSL